MTTRPPETNGSGSQVDNNSPMSPAASEVSFDSSGDSVGTMSVIDSQAPSAVTSRSGGMANSSSRHPSSRTITASIQLQRAGFLRGDNIPLQITVNHTKKIKSLQGIIVTLYRQARVDMHPALPLATLKGEDGKEDYYPKSRTGLGGLSLSSAGSTHVYRKDLSQSFAALIINPETLTAEVKTAVRVPDEAFPTISSVPGAMITFKYYVEVVVDIQGKLSGLDKMIPNVGMMAVPASYGLGQSLSRDDASGSMLAGWGGHFVDTEQIRRDKGVISCVFEVIVGTKDSDRLKGKRRQEEPLTNGSSTDKENVHEINLSQEQGAEGHEYHYQGDEYYPYDYEHHGNYYYDPSYNDHYPNAPPNAYSGSYYSTRQNPPIPSIAEQEAQLPEKERVRRAEERLLPSRPPDTADPISVGPSSSQISHAPSAPTLPDDPHADRALPLLPPPSPNELARSTSRATVFVPPAPPTKNDYEASSLAPDYHQPSHQHPHDSHQEAPILPVTDDKQELQRRRLEMERSAPPTDDPDDDASDAAATSGKPAFGSRTASRDFASSAFAPSAPALDEEDGLFETGEHETGLPRYER